MVHSKKNNCKIAFVAVLVTVSCSLKSQTTLQRILQKSSVHLGIGYSNYGGDLQQKFYTLQQAGFARNIGVGYNLSSRLHLRGEYTFGKIKADDKLNSKPVLQQRNLNFAANLFETSVNLQYDLIEESRYGLVPYVYIGAAYFKASPYTYLNGIKYYLAGQHTEGLNLNSLTEYSTKHISIPYGIGLRMRLNDVFSVNYELGFRKTFTDYIDDVSTNYANASLLNPIAMQLAYRGGELKSDATYPSGSIRGNPSKKDYYYFGLIKLQVNLGFLVNKGLPCPKM